MYFRTLSHDQFAWQGVVPKYNFMLSSKQFYNGCTCYLYIVAVIMHRSECKYLN